MADLSATIRLLEQQRDELLDQVNAIVRAIAALKGTDGSVRRAVTAPGAAAVPRTSDRSRPRKKRQFTLTEEHKQKLLEGQQRAREARERAAAGGQVSDSGRVADATPRLVKAPEQVS
jgi:hypothetical protein